MFLVGIFEWWYGTGLRGHLKQNFLAILRTADFFSVGLLLRTLFNPFRQISANNRSDGSLAEQIGAFTDRLFSRMIGSVVRTFMVIIGILVIILRTLLAGVMIFLWIILPFWPIVGIILWQMGVAL